MVLADMLFFGRIPLQPGNVICIWFVINRLWAQNTFSPLNLVGELYIYHVPQVEPISPQVNRNMLHVNVLH